MASTARITEIDISRPVRALTVLRWSDFVLVIGCGFAALALAVEAALAVRAGQWDEFLVAASLTATLGAVASTGWRHVGVIDPRVWRSYLWVFPTLAGISAFFAFVLVAAWIAQGINPFDGDPESVVAFFTYLQFALVAIPGFFCVLWLRRTRIAPMRVRLADLLDSLDDRRGEPPAHSTGVRRINTRRGLAYGIVGLALVLVVQFAPVSFEGRQATNVLRVRQMATLVGFFLIIRARRYFQVSADSLLAVDKRPPVLFLRSFTDDERQRFGSSQRALLDFSLETRLANHFHRFGPFIAIGSPTATVPQLGAARVVVSNDKWQSQVLEWMNTSSVIIMYCGTTQWVNWELRQIIERGAATRLILMFPEITLWRPSRRRSDIAARSQMIRQVFQDTPWAEELTEFSNFADLRAMLFRADGSMLMIRSRSRSREAYHLAALIAHQQLVEPEITAESVAARVKVPTRSRARLVALTLAAAIAGFGVFYLSRSDDGHRLTFQLGQLHYTDPVTQDEAQRVGEYLAQHQFFNQQNATTAELVQEQGRYQLRLVVNPALIEATLVTIEFGLISSGIAQSVLAGHPVDVIFHDPNMKPLKVVPPTARMEFGKAEILYTHPITAREARAVGDQLVALEYFEPGTAGSVHLSREDGRYQLRFIVADPSRVNERGVLDAFTQITRVVAVKALGGEPVVAHLCDPEFRTVKSLVVEARVPAQGR